MLYERWQQIANKYADEVALTDAAQGEQWTFARLAAEAERGGVDGKIVFPQGRDFVLTLLRGWRSGQMICPLEPGQVAPAFDKLPDDCAHLKMTSATTKAARTVAFTGAQLAADADNIVATMGLRREWPNLGVISLAHSYGFSNLVLPLVLQGIPLILLDAPLPETLKRAAAQTKFVTLAAVPALWRAWHEAGAIPGADKLKLAISAGAPLSVALEESVFAAQGVKIHNFYGSTECGGIAYDASDSPRTDMACIGAPMKNVNAVIGEDGCLQVRGGAVGTTYWPEAEANLGNGCFQTNDLAEIADGRVYIRGRAGDQINMAGRKLSPETIETILLAHPEVRDCLVFGVPSIDNERSESIVACIAGTRLADRESLKQFLLEKMPAWQIPREWVFVKSLEANSRGKLSRAEWRRKFMEARSNGRTSDFA
jgi:acyl-CoA synthetase (AMP-forming)/AMP-acid ligase II